MSTATKNRPTAKDAPAELLNLDPATLTLETNVRKLNATEQAHINELADNIAQVGVYTPLRGVRTTTGEVMIRDGQRRLLAAQQAKVDTVPVIVHTEDSEGDEREAARISQQVLANSGRALSDEDTNEAIDQLAMFGVSTDQIAARTGLDRNKVATTVATAGHESARAAANTQQLTLDQVQVLIEFEDDEDAVRHLTRAAQSGQFDHIAQWLRQNRAAEQARAEAEQTYLDRGINVFHGYPHYDPQTPDGDKLHPLNELVTAEGQPATTENVDPSRLWVYLTEDETYHTENGDEVALSAVDWEWTPDQLDEDGEPVALAEGKHDPATIETRIVWQVSLAMTTNPKADGLTKRPTAMIGTDPDADPEETAAALAEAQEAKRHERRRLIELNKAADAAAEVRREHITQLLTRKTPPKGGAKLTASVIATRVFGRSISDSSGLAEELLTAGNSTHSHSSIEKATDNRAQVIALAYTLATFEQTYTRSAWRDHPSVIKPYLEFLTTTGYTVAEVEKIITGEATADEAYQAITAATADQDEDKGKEDTDTD